MASFRKRGNKWQYRISHIDKISNRRIEVSKGGFDTKAEAKKAAIEHEAKLDSGHAVVAKNELLKDYLIEWLEVFKKPVVKKNTYISHKNSIENHILPYFKEIKLKDITHNEYQKFINHLAKNGFSTRTIVIIHTTMNNAMDKAVDEQKISKNICKRVAIPKNEIKEKEKLQYIDSSNIPNFLKVARQDNHIYFIFFKVLIYTGIRKGEAAALQWDDIDFVQQTMDINKSLDFQAQQNEDLFGSTKTYESKRKIKIPNELLEDLQKHKDYVDDNKFVFKDIYHNDLDLVFCRKDGNILPKSTLFNAFNRICKNADIQKLPIHALRHTHAVLLLESGATMKYVQERLGHKSISITSDIYSHISNKIENESMDIFDKYMHQLNSDTNNES
ncbi:tyrosine-type recombinase/integrase [Oceanobacillus caeni]